MNYEKGLKKLKACVEENVKYTNDIQTRDDFDLYEFQLREPDLALTEKNKVIKNLNSIARRLTDKSFSDLCEQTVSQYSTSTPDSFDLDDIIDKCDEILFEKRGLVGFGVHCTSRTFLTHFQTRLKKILGRNNVFASSLEDLHPFNIESALQNNVNSIIRHREKLKNQDVLLDIIVSSENATISFWQTIMEKFQAKFNNRLIIILMAEDSNLSFPEKLIKVPSPCFKKIHVIKWVRSVVDKNPSISVEYKKNFVSNWVHTIMNECVINNKLDVQYVYEHVNYALQELHSNSPVPTLYDFLEKRKQIYAET